MDLNCLHCGAPLEVPRDSFKVQCRYCKRVYENVNQNITADLSEISNRRQLREFIQAEELCNNHRPRMPKCAELYWQALLVEYGIVYVNDRVKNIPVPTFFHHSYDKGHELSDSENYKLAIEYAATKSDREFYETQVEELDAILKRHFELLAKEPASDIFISFKSTSTVQTIDGKELTIETEDSKVAREIYEYFTKKKYGVFFSPESIGKDKNLKGLDYEPRILKALQTSQAMVLLAGKEEYLRSEWVENEWKRYMYFIDKKKKVPGSLIIVYFGIPPKLPAALGAKIEHTMINAHSINFKEELSHALDFVRPGKKKIAQIKREIKTDFEGEALDYSDSGSRVSIGASRTINHISASEAREMQNANLYLTNKNYSIAYKSFKDIVTKNPVNGKAYFGMFLSRVKVKLSEKYTTGSMRGAYPTDITTPEDLIYNFKSVDSEAYSLLESAMNNPTDEDFTDNIIAMLMYQIAKSENSSQIVKLLNLLAKYIPNKSIKNLLDIVKGHCVDQVKAGNVKFAKALYESSREKLFISENNAFNMAFLRDFANSLYFSGYYDEAVEYMNTYLKASHEAQMYWNLLGCRLKGSPMKAFKLRIKSDDDAASKEPKELDLDEIIERILICAKCDFQNVTVKDVMRLVAYQIQENINAHRPFVECVGNCVLTMKGEAEYLEFLYKIAMVMIFERRFSEAKLYFTEMDSVISESDKLDEIISPTRKSEILANIRWGLLKCRLKAIDDYEVCRVRKRLEDLPEYRDALNSATEAQYNYFSSVYSAHQNRQEEVMKKFACLPELRKFSSKANEIMPQFGVVSSFYSPRTMKTKAAASKKSKKAATSVLAALLILGVLAFGAYLGFVKTCTVSFDAPGMNIESVTTNFFRRVEDPGRIFKPGHTFAGWYDENGKPWNFEKTITFGDVVLHPEWKYGSEGLKFKESTFYSGMLFVKGYEGSDSLVNIPAEYDGKPVYRVENEAFLGNSVVEKVVVPSGVTQIGLKAFANCENLSKVYIPATCTAAGSDLFYGSNPTLYFQTGTQYSNWDYYWNTGVSGNIPTDAITFIEGVTEDGFGYTTVNVSAVSDSEGEDVSNSYASVDAYFGVATKLTVPSEIAGYKVTVISGRAFENEARLSQVVIPESVRYVSSKAFSGCDKIVSVINYATEISVASDAFESVSTLWELYDTTGAFAGAFDEVKAMLSAPDAEGPVKFDGDFIFINHTDEVSGETTKGLAYYVGFDAEVKLPENLGGEPYMIFDKAFASNRSVVSIVLSGGVTELGGYVFGYCPNLERVYITAATVVAGNNLFAGCDGAIILMEHDAAPEGFATGWNGSENEVVLSVTSESGTTDAGLFWVKKKDNSITVLKLVGKPDDVYSDTVDLKNEYGLINSPLYAVDIPEKINDLPVTAISKNLFKNRYLMQTVYIPGSVKELYEGMFSGCISLEAVGLPNLGKMVLGEPAPAPEGEGTVQELLEYYPLGYYFGDKSYSYKELDELYGTNEIHSSVGISQDYFTASGGKTSKTYYFPPKLYGIEVIDDGYIAPYACQGMYFITAVHISEGVKVIPEGAFANCSELEKITLPKDITAIGAGAFSCCDKLVTVELPATVASIGEGAFENCKNLKKLSVGNAVGELPARLVAGCGSLEELVLPFIGKTSSTTTERLAEEVLTYFFGTTSFAYTVTDESGALVHRNGYQVISLDATQLYYIPYSLKTVTVTAETVIPEFTFNKFISLTAVNLPDGVKEIGACAFQGCTALTSFALPKECEVLRSSAFQGCTELTTVTVPTDSKLTTMEYEVFRACAKLTVFDIPATVTTVLTSVFADCPSVTVYCAAAERGEGWSLDWAFGIPKVVLGYDGALHKYEFVNVGGNPVDTVTSRRVIELPIPTHLNPDMKFVGWFDNPEFIGKPVESKYYSRKAVTLYAMWTPTSLNGISFDSSVLVYEAEPISFGDNIIPYRYCQFIAPETADYVISFSFKSSNSEMGLRFERLGKDGTPSMASVINPNTESRVTVSLEKGERAYFKLNIDKASIFSSYTATATVNKAATPEPDSDGNGQ